MPSAPWAWAVTLRPMAWAACTMAFSSSSVNFWPRPAAVVCGVSFAIAQFVSSNFISVELTDIIASLVAVGATMAFLRVWQPSGTEEAINDLRAATAEAEDVPGAGGVTPAGRADDRSETASGPGRTGGTSGGSAVATPAASSRELTAGRIMMALVPYIIVIAVFSIAKLFGPVKTFLLGTDVKIEWPGLHGNVLSAASLVALFVSAERRLQSAAPWTKPVTAP